MLEWLVGDLGLEDLAYLADIPALYERLYLYDHENLSCRNPRVDEVPWVVAYALGRWSGKHRFCRSAPDLSAVQAQITNAINRLQWKYHFNVEPDTDFLEAEVGFPAAALAQKGTCAPCTSKHIPMSFKIWCQEVRRRLMESCVDTVRQYQHQRDWRSHPRIL